MAITYKGIVKDALEMDGIFLTKDNHFDRKKMEEWKEQFNPIEYKTKPVYNLDKDDYGEFI